MKHIHECRFWMYVKVFLVYILPKMNKIGSRIVLWSSGNAFPKRIIEVCTSPDWISAGLSADVLVDTINESADVGEDANGRVWVYYYDQKADITELFDDEGFCRVTMTHEGQVIYLEIERGENATIRIHKRVICRRRKSKNILILHPNKLRMH